MTTTGLPASDVHAQGVTGGFSVNTQDREQVRDFYNAVFLSSENVPMGSTSDVANCIPGTNAMPFNEAVLRRINWYRAMAGVPASVTFSALPSARCQEAAVIMSRNQALSHFPLPEWLCFTGDGANAASNSNLALGYAGAQAITAYIQDAGPNNTVTGHRRWILYPQTQVMGTGDVPGQGAYPPANATWVFDENIFGPRPATRDPFVAWPPPGFVPRPVVFPRWSLSVSNANLSAATVSMTRDGIPIPAATEPYDTGVGENTLVWVPLGLDPNNPDVTFPFEGSDRTYEVTVSNVTSGGNTFSISYSVTIFDPAQAGPGHVAPAISGPIEPGVGQENLYAITQVPRATGYEWRAALRQPFSLFDGAESGLGNFDVDTSAGYPVWISAPVASGNRAFNLQHREPVEAQFLTLRTNFLVQPDSVLTFRSRLHWASSSEFARVQISTNGAEWQDVYFQAGTTGIPGETTFFTRTVPLGSAAGSVARLRFNFYAEGLYYPGLEPGDGWVIDNIALTNIETFAVTASGFVSDPQFSFVPPQPGLYSLQARALIYEEFPLSWGPPLDVSATTNVPALIVSGIPVVSDGAVVVDFSASGTAGSFRLLESSAPEGPWSTNAIAVLSTNTPGASYRFTTTATEDVRFYRIQSP